MSNCLLGIMKDGVFYPEGSHPVFRPLVKKGLVVPEGVKIFLKHNQHVVDDYILVN